MKRFIRYLYEYGQGRRLRNVGFVKVEQGSEDCVLHIHGKGLHLEEEQGLKLCLICTEEKECIGIWQGDVEHVNPAINYRMYYTREDTLRPELFDRVCGMALVSGQGRIFAALWEEGAADVEKIRLVDPRTEQAESKEKPEEEARIEVPDTEMPEADGLVGDLQEENQPEETQNEEIKILAEEKNGAGMRCTKIRREDLAVLPRCEWKLSNNSFLLHGYYNYHHLVFLDDGEWLRLGVPGIYHVKEARAAAAFGFPEFIRRKDLEEPFGEEEEEPDFGYWCRCVKRQKSPRL